MGCSFWGSLSDHRQSCFVSESSCPRKERSPPPILRGELLAGHVGDCRGWYSAWDTGHQRSPFPSSCSLGGAQKKASFWCGELGSVVRRCLQFHSIVTSACRHFLMGKNRPLAVQTPTEPPGQVQKPGTQPIGSPDTAWHKHPVSGSPAGRPSRTYQLYCSKYSLWGHTPKPWKPHPV